MGAHHSRVATDPVPDELAPPAPKSSAPTVVPADAVGLRVDTRQHRPRTSASSVPQTHKERQRVKEKREEAPPVWDPRSPSMARTPPKMVREIRASVVLQEKVRWGGLGACERPRSHLCPPPPPHVCPPQIAKQIAELAEADQARRRNTTQLSSLPSFKALRIAPASSPKRLHPRIDLDTNPAETTQASPTTTAAADATSTPDSSATRRPRPSGFARAPNGLLSPLSEYVESEFVKSYESPAPTPATLTKITPGTSLGRGVDTSLEECKECKAE